MSDVTAFFKCRAIKGSRMGSDMKIEIDLKIEIDVKFN